MIAPEKKKGGASHTLAQPEPSRFYHGGPDVRCLLQEMND
jgi:hypothetical protein